MFEQKIHTGLSNAQIFLLKNLAYLPQIPIKAKDLFDFLEIDQSKILEFFDALHDLVPEWLEYDGSYYVMPNSKATRVIRELRPSIKDLFRLMEYFIKRFSSPEEYGINLLTRLEPYLLALLKNFKQNSVTLAELHAAYGYFLAWKKQFSKAIPYYQSALNILNEAQPGSGLEVSYHSELGLVYFQLDELDKALQHAEKAIKALQKFQRRIPDVEIKIYFLIGEVLFKQQYFRSALTYYLRAIDILYSYNVKHPHLNAYLHTQIAESYRQLHEYQNALRHLSKAEQLVEEHQTEENQRLKEHIRIQKNVIQNLDRLAKLKSKLVTYLTIVAIGSAILALGLFAAFLILR